MKISTKIWLCSFTLSLLLPLAAHAELYKWVDEQGNVTYSQVPPPAGTEVKTIRAQRGPSPAPAPKSVSQDQAKAEKNGGAADAKANPAAQDLDAIRKKNCEAARKNKEIYTTFRRIQNDKGEVEVLEDNVRAAKLKDADADIKQYCTE